MTDDQRERCLQMAEAAERDAAGFWPKAPLYALERREAAKVWRVMAESSDADDIFPPIDPIAAAEALERQAERDWAAGHEAEAVTARVRADAWRRIARISEGGQS